MNYDACITMRTETKPAKVDCNTLVLSIIKSRPDLARAINQHDIADECMLRSGEPITPRRVRRIIEELIRDGEPIISTPHNPNGGYCYNGADGEAIQCVKRLKRKGIKVLLRARRILRNSRKGQLGLFGDVEGFVYNMRREGVNKMDDEKHYCLYCEVELDFIPTEDGGFCSTECEDRYFENPIS